MKFGVELPNLDARTFAELAHDAEEAAWDGVFIWDCLFGTDPWVALTAAAMCTQRMRLGTMVTPVARRHPWKLANETATLDQLSNGRLILPVGLGVAEDEKWDQVGLRREMERKVRAKLFDEGLEVLTGLWKGQPFSFEGEYHQIQIESFPVTAPLIPAQSPRIPIWVTGGWPKPPKTQLRRMLRWDGVVVIDQDADVSALRAFLAEHRTEATPFDIVMAGSTPGDDPTRARAIVAPRAEAGVTWWIESFWEEGGVQVDVEGMRRRIQQGPPPVG